MQALNANTQSMGVSFTGTDTLSQIVTGLVLIIILYLVLSTVDFLYSSFTAMYRDRVELFPNTYASGSQMYTAIQNPTNPNSATIYQSNNQRYGVEFSYSMFLFINSTTINTSGASAALCHILHKGYSMPYPLLGPGIFCWNNINTIRIYMNSFNTWDNYVEVENIPMNKWFHLVVSCKGNSVYVYINGNIKTKLNNMPNSPPYQNYGNVYAFSSIKPPNNTINPTITASSKETLNFAGSASGMISRVYYFSYALTYTEIQTLINMGPSTVISGSDMSMVPYLSDTWWTNRNGP